MTPLFCRDNHSPGTDGLCHQWIHGKGMLGKDHLMFRDKYCTSDQFQYLVGTIAQCNLIGVHRMVIGECSFQAKTVAIRITR